VYKEKEIVFKVSVAPDVAHPSFSPITEAGKRVLHAVAGARNGIAPQDVVLRSGLPRRTVYYWLGKFVRDGYVERVGKARSPGVFYRVTRKGLLYLNWLGFQCCTVGSGKVRVRGVRGLRRLAGGRVRVVVPLRVVWDGRAGFRFEVGVRGVHGVVRGVVGGVAGFRLPRRRVGELVVYVRDGVVHADCPVSPDVAVAVDFPEDALLFVEDRYWVALVMVVAVLLALGVPRETLLRVVEAVDGRLVWDEELAAYA
jgi:DNA-binding transcriptional ArsR family regulator